MIVGIILGIVISLIFSGIILYLIKNGDRRNASTFDKYAKEALSTSIQEIMKTARDELGSEKKDIVESVNKDLKQNADIFKDMIQSVKTEIDKRQDEIRKLEDDRNKKYGEITQALVNHETLTKELRGTTDQLTRILGNNQIRGKWGELQAEKILEHAGMIEGKHFVKQKKIEDNSSLKPDFTIFLPNKMELYVDVKFPLQSLQLALDTENKAEKASHFKQFGSDLKARITETGKYVINKPNSVDYVILFVPSESVFSLINKHFASIIDSCFGQKVILAGPYSFFAIVRTIQESYVHFYYEQNLQEILKYLKDLLTHFERFKGEFSEVGRAIEGAQRKISQITETRYKQIDITTNKINKYQIANNEEPISITSGSPEDEALSGELNKEESIEREDG